MLGRMRACLCFLLIACSGPEPGIDAGMPVSCDEPDRACPSGAPVWGGPCEGTLSCPYEACGPGSDDIYECVGGEWTLTMPVGCAGGSPPQAETCNAPFSGTFSGRVWISEDRAGAPELEDGATVPVVFGAQGFAMIPYRVHVDGDGAPDCVRIRTTLTLDAMEGVPAPHDVRMRCGATLLVQDILPMLPCELRTYDVSITVEVEGIGSVSRDLAIMGGMCPRKMG